MSVTFTIDGNLEHCDKHHLWTMESYEDFGKVEHFRVYPFDMTVCNGAFGQICDLLNIAGLDHCGGEIDPEELEALVIHADAKDCIVEPVFADGEMGCIMITDGYNEGRNSRYLAGLLEIAQEAIKRRKMVIWY